MKIYLKPLKIEQVGFKSERRLTIPTNEGEKRHFVDESTILDGKIEVYPVETKGTLVLVDLPYCMDPMRCWIHMDNLLSGK